MSLDHLVFDIHMNIKVRCTGKVLMSMLLEFDSPPPVLTNGRQAVVCKSLNLSIWLQRLKNLQQSALTLLTLLFLRDACGSVIQAPNLVPEVFTVSGPVIFINLPHAVNTSHSCSHAGQNTPQDKAIANLVDLDGKSQRVIGSFYKTLKKGSWCGHGVFSVLIEPQRITRKTTGTPQLVNRLEKSQSGFNIYPRRFNVGSARAALNSSCQTL